MPCYNEGDILERSYQQLRAYLDETDWQGSLAKTWEIIVVNDGSKDQTDVVVAGLMAHDKRVRLCTYPHNAGQGKALQTGFAHARGDWIFCVDADLDYSPEHIERFLREAVRAKADMVVGSPYMRGGRTENVPWVRLLMSKAVNRYFAFVCKIGVSTFTGIVRLYRRTSLERLLLTSRDKDILPEILIKAHTLGMKIVEAPAHLCWKKEVQQTRGRGIGVFSTARKVFRHLLWGVVENPGFFFSIPLTVSVVGFLWFTRAVVALFLGNFHASDLGILADITNTLSQQVHAHPQTFLLLFLFFFTSLILSCIGLIIYQNKTKKEQDFICFTLLAEAMRQRQTEAAPQEAPAVPPRLNRAG
jgi:glycosyltransferase involved in cell wall biosynthesis